MDDDIRFTRGVPTDEELAAIVGVLWRVGRPVAPPAPEPVSHWARSARPGVGARGPGGWRTSSRPTYRLG